MAGGPTILMPARLAARSLAFGRAWRGVVFSGVAGEELCREEG